MTKWSGLAPAVDAHLRRWSQAHEGLNMAARIVAEQGENEATIQAAIDGLPTLRRWLIFGLSYGVTGADGKAMMTMARVQEGGQGYEVGLVPADAQPFVPGFDHGQVGRSMALADGATITGRERFGGGPLQLLQGAMLAYREVQMLDAATTHYVSTPVVDEVTLAASLAEPEPLYETDLFAPSGFAVLEKPILVPDLDIDTGIPRDDLHVAVRAIGWHAHDGLINLASKRMGKGVTLWLYGTPADHAAVYVPEFNRAYPDRQAVSAEEAGEGNGPFLPLEVIPWSFDTPWTVRDEVIYVPGTVPSPVSYQRRWFLALMRLCWQTVIVHHRDRMPRQQVRRWERDAKRKPLLDYTVLRLRRYDDPEPRHETGTGRALDHRVLVRGHWRRQHYPSLGPARLAGGAQDPLTHRLVWVEPHWRGPEDGPVGAMHHATVVVR